MCTYLAKELAPAQGLALIILNLPKYSTELHALLCLFGHNR